MKPSLRNGLLNSFKGITRSWGRVLALGVCFTGSLRSIHVVKASSGAPHQWSFGALKVDGDSRTVVFPAKLNLREGALEYGLVTKTGPVHESLLVTAVNPVEIHAAFLLLGVNGQNIPPVGVRERLDSESLRNAPELAGQPVEVKLVWNEGGQEKRTALEDWLIYTDGRKVASGPWLYTGSYMQEGGGFAAQSEGSVLCLVSNPASLLNNPRSGRTDDHAWAARTAVLPPSDTDVTVEIALLPSAKIHPEQKPEGH